MMAVMDSIVGARMTHDEVAHVAYDATLAYMRAVGSVGGWSEWQDAPKSLRESAEGRARTYIESPSTTCSQIHDQWRFVQRRSGWEYSSDQNDDLGFSPMLCDWNGLDPQLRIVGEIFRAVVLSLARELELHPTA